MKFFAGIANFLTLQLGH